MAHRFHRDFTPHWVQKNFERTMPRKASRIFVNSMSDVADWRDEWHARVLDRIHQRREHRFLFLSKRPWKVPGFYDWFNIMLGYSVTQQADMDALLLNGGPGDVSFLSIEPLLDRVEEPTLWTPRWIIVGAETGNRKGKVSPDIQWLEEIHAFARRRSVPLFFKESLRPFWHQHEADFPQEYPAW
jgi:protein gp37